MVCILLFMEGILFITVIDCCIDLYLYVFDAHLDSLLFIDSDLTINSTIFINRERV